MEFRANQTFLHGTQRYEKGEVYGEDPTLTRYFVEQGWVNTDLDQSLELDALDTETFEVEFKPQTIQLEVENVKSRSKKGWRK